MAANNIYEFGQETLNILNNADYLADPSLIDGILAGSKAKSELHNKIFKQATLCAAGLSQFAADNQDEDIDDSMTVEEYAEALTDAIDARVNIGINDNIITQPQFDNSTHAATDEFVNRALGSYSNSRIIDESVTTLEITDVGQIISYVPTTGTNGAITLPDYNDVRLGSVIEVQSLVQEPYFLEVLPISGQNMLTQRNTSLSYILLNYGDTAKFAYIDQTDIGGAKSWMLIGGTKSLQYSDTFKQSKTASGYYYLPGNLVLQWGTATLPNSGDTTSSVHVTFPTPFPSACLHITATSRDLVNTGAGSVPVMLAKSVTSSSFDLSGDSNASASFNHSVPVYWFAIGC